MLHFPVFPIRLEMSNADLGHCKVNVSEGKGFSHSFDELFSKVNELEQGVDILEQFYMAQDNKNLDNVKCSLTVKDKMNIEKQQRHGSNREAAAEKRRQELIHQFAGIFYHVIENPMDLGTIKNKLEAKSGTGYRNVREIYADVRLVFKNAMKYNDERDDVHIMAKKLLEKFEEKWLQLLPKVAKEEKRQAKDQVAMQAAVKLAQEASHANMARDLNNELCEVDMKLGNLRKMVIQECRKTSVEEKKKLGTALTLLSPGDLTKALEIVADDNPSFQATAQEVDLDMDSQSELTLWRLRIFVKDALKVDSADKDENKDLMNMNSKNVIPATNNNNKRRREICDAINKSRSKKTKTIS
ncbi:transcription factor GTE1-like isoform X3 [Euphorbia lathyris]|uniref:transcription factor GTE1-like isoform X3 n=1 Tax=Euphorbia lathyris TaxID=212925 RepID=UPI003313B104